MENLHNWLQAANAVIVIICQFLAMVVIMVGIAKATRIYFADVLTPGRSEAAVKQGRLELGYSFSLALGFLIGASILKTTLAPTWADIGQLAAIIAIRTILNYFLLHDIATQSREGQQLELWSLFHRGKHKDKPSENE
ncbi:hypothetical protein STSP2_02067 [Anaerohalosphaera lusitana]|uniref:DUF1622 domain-containing protein n=1 Tax=Anaerohalosphaera lusitana TaxID=1936003 RepID=A0A1U9NMR5_9BACT|nr:DUF1622 domain-containing protein [Anaerohalosphaera lusitana]AQT68890.1 hypothetical protein STSP2_02067 [Anaerohalosphaera lusitana]